MAVQHASTSSLHSEQGSILLVGLAMLLPLVALLWFVVGIGDAIAHRERLQDGADAVAFAGAVTHARGMNLIVTINILMAGILSVLVAVKVLQLINSIAMAISCALAIFGFTAPICTATTSLQAPIASTIPPVQSAIDTVLPILSKMQVGVARATPALALAYSIAAGKDNETLGAESPFAMMASVPLALPHIGLPVEEDSFQTLCGKAGSTIGNLVFRPFGTFGTWIGGAVGAITQTFPLYFCGDAGNFDIQKGITDRFEAAAKKVCEEEQASLTGEALAKSKETCLKTKSGDMKSQFEKTGKIPDSAGLAAAAKTPKKMYHRAFNGNGYFQVWGVLRYRDPRLERDLRGIRVAGGEIPADEVSEPSAGFSQAEYFYDAPDPWAVAQGASMWNPKWRARLVRVRPIEAATSMLEGWVAWKLTDYVNTYVFKPMGSHGQASALLMNSPEAGKYVKGPINDLVRKGTNEGFDAAERILGNPSLGIIH